MSTEKNFVKLPANKLYVNFVRIHLKRFYFYPVRYAKNLIFEYFLSFFVSLLLPVTLCDQSRLSNYHLLPKRPIKTWWRIILKSEVDLKLGSQIKPLSFGLFFPLQFVRWEVLLGWVLLEKHWMQSKPGISVDKVWNRWNAMIIGEEWSETDKRALIELTGYQFFLEKQF